MMTFLLAAAAATAQTAPTNDADIRCMAAYLVVAGQSKDDAAMSADDKAGIQSIVMYFFGKIDARKPGIDLRGEINRLLDSADYVKTLRPDIERCSAEAETRGKYLESFGDEAGPAPKR
jgi:hypothetical protein